MIELIRRQAATQATFNKWKGKPFAWGKADCARLVHDHVQAMGHKVRIAKAGSYSSALGAKRALNRMGHDNLAAAMDAHFPRIPAATALPGDIVSGEGDDTIGTLGVVLGNGAVIGWHEDAEGAVAVRLEQPDAAWRVMPVG